MLLKLGIVHVLRQFRLINLVRLIKSKADRDSYKNVLEIRERISRDKSLFEQFECIISQRDNDFQNDSLIMAVEGTDSILLQLPLIFALVNINSRPIVMLPSRHSQNQKIVYEALGIKNFVYFDDLIFKSIDKKTYTELSACETISQFLKVEYRNIQIGKFAVSTMMRRLRKGKLDFLDKYEKRELIKLAAKCIGHVNAAYDLIGNIKPKEFIFLDRGYTPDGPFFEVALLHGILPITMNAAHKDNALMIKRYCPETSSFHPSSLSNETWECLSHQHWSKGKWLQLKGEIESCYVNGQWYGEVATQVDTKLKEKKYLFKRLNLSPNKKIALIFPHIFWDATFFWGEDVYLDYEDWFRETVKCAIKNKKVNWIIKIHPANITKNIRDQVNGISSEEQVLREFGKLPSHISVIYPETDISTLSLFQIGHYCLTVRGTVGIEASAFGLKVVTAGTGRYNNLGFTLDPKTKKEYENILKELEVTEPMTEAQIEAAQKFAFGILKLRPTNLNAINFFYEKSRDAKLRTKIKNFQGQNVLESEDIKEISHFFLSHERDYISRIEN